MAENAPVSVFEIKNYMIIWRQLELREFDGVEAQIRGIVRCIGDDHTMDVYFLADNSPFPAPVVNLDEKRGAIFLPIRDMLSFVDTLRNEKPIYGHLRGDKPEWTSVTTGEEPVGEGEMDL